MIRTDNDKNSHERQQMSVKSCKQTRERETDQLVPFTLKWQKRMLQNASRVRRNSVALEVRRSKLVKFVL